ncbi:MAG: primosomal protein N' [Methylococcales bacterium]|nr:primosomal protein N' [Methylococcales bacterium]
MNIVQLALPVPIYSLFDYLWPDTLPACQPGMRVKVPFGRQTLTGFVVTQATVSSIAPGKLKPVSEALDKVSLFDDQDWAFLLWICRYYHHPLGEVLAQALPVLLRQGQPLRPLAKTSQYRLSVTGKAAESSLRRAPKQQALWRYFQTQNDWVGESVLPEGHSVSALQALLDKDYLELRQTPAFCWRGTDALARADFVPNSEQQQAIEGIISGLGGFQPCLLEGITGSGKTEVYLHVIGAALARGKQVLVLVPEINLTPQLEQRFRARLQVPLVISHSRMTAKARLTAWQAMCSGQAALLLGTRSALFTPMPRPGLLILDEEHDASYKQHEGFRFSARDLAVARARRLGIPVVLGTATPSLSSWFNVSCGRYQHYYLAQRTGQAQLPKMTLLDIRAKRVHHGLSEALLAAMRAVLARGEQVLLFLNRRGFAPTLMCHSCGWVANCPGCDANLVVHAKVGRVRCHHCQYQRRVPEHCPDCASPALITLGLGIQQVEQGLAELFPDTSVVRIDRDSTRRKGALELQLTQIHQGDTQIILGTQMLAKGHHFPNVTLAALLDVDSGLFSVDFMAAERLAQLIVQVAGRAGRDAKRGEVILQTRQPEHPLLTRLVGQGYRAALEWLLQERQQAGLPPFSFLALIRAEAHKVELALAFLERLKAAVPATETEQWRGPAPAPRAKQAGRYRAQLVLHSMNRAGLHEQLARLERWLSQQPHRAVRCSIDVDPAELA